MRERKEIVAYCLTLENVYEDYPFEDDNWTVIRHRENKKIFAWIFERQGNIWINLKGEPAELDFFRRVYASVLPAYHLNKEHWNSVVLNGEVPEDALRHMIEESYRLTLPHAKRREVGE